MEATSVCRNRNPTARRQARRGLLATATDATSRHEIPAFLKQKRIASRGIPDASRDLMSFASSIAVKFPFGSRSAAEESCASAESPRMYPSEAIAEERIRVVKACRKEKLQRGTYGRCAPNSRPPVKSPRSPIRINRGWLAQIWKRTFRASSREYSPSFCSAEAFSKSTSRL